MSKKEKQLISPEFDTWLQENDPRKVQDVPVGYFESFADQLMARVSEKDTASPVSKAKVIKLPYYWISAVAASAVILVAALMFFQNSDAQINNTFADLNTEYTLDYILENSSDYSLAEIVEYTEMDQAFVDLESELYSQNLSEDFIDNIDIELLEDLYE